MKLTKSCSDDLNTCHGGILAIAELCLGWGKDHIAKWREEKSTSSKDIIETITRIPISIPQHHLSSFGSELIRIALCHLITNLAKVDWPIHYGFLTHSEDVECCNISKEWMDFIWQCFDRKEESIRISVVNTIAALSSSWGLHSSEIDKYPFLFFSLIFLLF